MVTNTLPTAGARAGKADKTGFKDHLQSIRMIIQPALLAAPACLLWHFLYKHGWHSTPAADEPIVNAILPILATAHVFLASFVLVRETDDLRKLRAAVKEGDKVRFIEIAEDRIPTPMKYILFVTAHFIQGWTISLYYETYWSGFFSVLSVAYMLSLIWEMIADFDDPVNGVWVVKNVPPEWAREADITRRFSDRFFELLKRKLRR